MFPIPRSQKATHGTGPRESSKPSDGHGRPVLAENENGSVRFREGAPMETVVLIALVLLATYCIWVFVRSFDI